MRFSQTLYFPHIKKSPSLTIILIVTYNFLIDIINFVYYAIEKKNVCHRWYRRLLLYYSYSKILLLDTY